MTDIGLELYTKFKNGAKTTELAKQYGLTKNAVVGRIDRTRRKIAAGLLEEPIMVRKPCTIMELTYDSCRYILAGREPLYCNAQRTKGSFCAEHARLCYRVSKLTDEEIAVRRVLRVRNHLRLPIVT